MMMVLRMLTRERWWWLWRWGWWWPVTDDKTNGDSDDGYDDAVDDDVSMMTEHVKVSRLWIHLVLSTLQGDDGDYYSMVIIIIVITITTSTKTTSSTTTNIKSIIIIKDEYEDHTNDHYVADDAGEDVDDDSDGQGHDGSAHLGAPPHLPPETLHSQTQF